MKRKLTDEQIDKLMSAIVTDASSDDALIDEIVASPTLWWNVRREIGQQAEANVAPWPPVKPFRRWLMFAVPTLAAAAVILGIFVFRPNIATRETAGLQQVETLPAIVVSPPKVSEPAMPTVVNDPMVKAETVRSTNPARAIKVRSSGQKDLKVKRTTASEAEKVVKSEFIALTYAQNPESGQIVRVKVPRSMMVTLGLVASVDKPTSLVDAEVIVGDDGTTHSIRFVR